MARSDDGEGRPCPSSRVGRGVAGWLAGLVIAAGPLACGPPSPAPQPRVAASAGETGEAGDPLEPRAPLQLAAVGPTETVVIAVRALPELFDPLGELDPWGQRVVDDLLFEGLVRRTPAGHPWAEPALADRCRVDEDTRGLRCHLPEGRSFHDGAPVTVDDVVYSLEGWLGGRSERRRLSYGLGGLKAIEVDDGPSDDRDPGRWLRITFEDRDPLILERIAAMKVVPRARHRGRAQAFAHEPIGSGPMRLVSLDKEKMVLERREDADPERTGARRIVLRALPDGAQALMLLRRGEVHLVADVSPVHVPKELAKPGMAARFRAFLLTPPRYDLLLFNLREGAQSGPRLRAALAQAIPWATLEGEVYGRPGLRPAAPVDLEAPRPIDLVALADGRLEDAGLEAWLRRADPEADAAAAALAATTLDSLGWEVERGIRRRSTGQLRLPLMWDGAGGLASELSGALRAAWREIGVQVPSVTAHWGYLTKPLSAGNFSLALVRYTDVSEGDLYTFFHSRGRANFTGVVDPALDAAIEAFREARTPPLRQEAQRAIARRLAELQPVTVLQAPLEIMLASRRITDLRFVDDLPRLDRLGLGGEASDAPLVRQ